eukprot:TRINITY_DN302_c2_g1_i2.p1 TRINITY_DN302_c2_g1~~TRINITY_DN302_c2_g1_i2.p1  ORF type:complete len:159 (+),score=57.65 TRINITY_DN302_c2_g1_i2:57-479(+)
MSDWFFIVSENNADLVLDVDLNACSNRNGSGARLIVYSFTGKDNQKFRFTNDGFLMCKASGLVLDVNGGLIQGADVIQYPAHGGTNQKWSLRRDGSICITSNNYLTLDIQNGSRVQGAKVILWAYHGGLNQRWRLCNTFY